MMETNGSLGRCALVGLKTWGVVGFCIPRVSGKTKSSTDDEERISLERSMTLGGKRSKISSILQERAWKKKQNASHRRKEHIRPSGGALIL